MNRKFTIWQLLLFMTVVAFVAVTWVSRLEHQELSSKLEQSNAELIETKKQLDKTEVGLLREMQETIAKEPEPFSSHGIAKEVAERIAINHPNDNYIWWVLTKTGGLTDDMSLSDAEAILGPATDLSNPEFAYWYDGASDDPEKLRATRSGGQLKHWIVGRESNFNGKSNSKPRN